MPTYEYACDSCQQVTEAYQSFTDAPLVECPSCGGNLKRVFHPVGIMFKGTGFYSTDAKSSKQTGNGQKKDGRSGAKADSTSGSSSRDSGSSSKDSGSSGKASETKP